MFPLSPNLDRVIGKENIVYPDKNGFKLTNRQDLIKEINK